MTTRTVEVTYRTCDRCGALGDDASPDYSQWSKLSAHQLDRTSLTPGKVEVDLCSACSRTFASWFDKTRLSHPNKAKGGFAAAAAMTPDERQARGRRGAEGRWHPGKDN